jgi:toxin ParE1/3/4
LGIRDFRQVILRPYRIIYRALDDAVVITLIADGRRDIQSLPARRLLAG